MVCTPRLISLRRRRSVSYTHLMIGMQVHPGRVLVNAAALVIEAFVLLAGTPLYGLWTGIDVYKRQP